MTLGRAKLTRDQEWNESDQIYCMHISTPDDQVPHVKCLEFAQIPTENTPLDPINH